MMKDELLEFALQKLGMSEEELLADQQRMRVIELVSAQHTIRELLAIAEKEGLLDALYSMRFSDITPDGKLAHGGQRRIKRLTKSQAQELERGILDYLEANPRSPIGDVAEHVGFDVQKVRTKLMLMKNNGSLASEGTGRETVYLRI